MSWEYDEEAYKEYTRQTWNASVDSYEPWIQALEPFNETLLEGVAPLDGQRVLDIATGPGEPALSIAELVGSEGEVLGIDLSDRMIERARQAAKQAQISNAQFELIDAEDMDLEDASFDAAVCRSSLQIFPAPSRALEEVARVLKPGGRFATSVWAAPGERSPALHAIIGPMLRHCTPDETGYIPTPYELGGPGTLVEMVENAGLVVEDERRITIPLHFPDRDAYLQAMLKGTPVGHSLEEESQEVQDAVMEETRWNLDRWNEGDEGLVLDSEAVVVHARRPESTD